ncbi:class I SAM-dependent methyltransferase [Congregibacter brevis]|uniref:Class I SAM-dependent methyltransferase n=1 Tax=Congregibacter brevis TaxID=3081201 RepID=A0ABZ0IF71_9GAMM|nr:class I SAM-dependent methyltransferase [Congregibacter sp. IMCC45268]
MQLFGLVKKNAQLSRLRDACQTLSSQEWEELYLSHARGERHDIVPFPDASTQELTNNLNGEKTAISAIQILNCMMRSVGEIREPVRGMRVLDYGCGWGRMTRLLPFYFDPQAIVGVDVDEHLIRSAKTLVPCIKHSRIKNLQALPFKDGSFDLVLANSVFSHLSELACKYAFAQISRVLSPGGTFVFSALGRPQLDKFYSNKLQRSWIENILGSREDAITTLNQQSFVWGATNRWDQYGIAIAEPLWLRQRLDEVGIEYVSVDRSEDAGTHNYITGLKR